MDLTFPEPVKAMLAGLGEIPHGPDWVYEPKFDGIRAVVYLSAAGGLRVLSRNDRDITAGYPELEVLPRMLAGRAVVLDGELVTLDQRGAPSFSALQRRMHVKRVTAALLAAAPVQYVVFDLLHLDGSLVARPWQERRNLLEGLGLYRLPIQVSPVFESEPQAVFDAMVAEGLEGIVAKRRDAAYQPGRRSPSWVKVPANRTQEVIVVGWRPGEGRRAGTLGSLLLAVPGDNGLLDFVGAVGTGFTDLMLDQVLARLRALALPVSPVTGRPVPPMYAKGARWVRPELVGEISFRNWTPDMTVRHPSWRGWRDDKSPSDVVLVP